MDPKYRRPAGTESNKINTPATTMEALRAEASREGVPLTAIINRVLNAYARGEIRQVFVQQQVA